MKLSYVYTIAAFSLAIIFNSIYNMDLHNKDSVKKLLSDMVAADQSMRSRINISNPSSTDLQAMQEADRLHIDQLQAILAIHDWVTISAFGAKADHDAWLLVQHADHDLAFQKSVLDRLEKLYQIHETSASNYAYLYDRVAIAENRLQRYGTQGTIEHGAWRLNDVEDPSLLDSRRKDVGLPPYQEYLAKIHRAYNLNPH